MKNIENKLTRMRKLMLESEDESDLEKLKKGIRTILQKQKENKDEDAYYKDLEDLLKDN